ncbi:MAG: hypothetical protein GF417_11760, partial [Candidatus Latescibacteria bacterium]|nr:hypothetical protein [bacterium]MBD3425101.1 hypothetical protein [Candidatus Latescibacterota bacterium]
MKRVIVAILVIIIATSAGDLRGRDIEGGKLRVTRDKGSIGTIVDTGIPGVYQAVAQADTYNIVKYDFELLDWQGWTWKDVNAQPDIFWHATEFDGDPDPSDENYTPIEGLLSMWCGAPAGDDYYLCGWVSAPGYGNNWDQWLVSDQLSLTESVGISFVMVHHVEGYGYDQVYLEYENDYEEWVAIQVYGSGNRETLYFEDTVVVDTSSVSDGSTRIRFRVFSDGAWSDEDGLLSTSGACIVDSITLYVDGSEYDYEDFETATQGQKAVGKWSAGASPGYVDAHPSYLGPQLRTGMTTNDDPCTSNFGSQVEFFDEAGLWPADQMVYPNLYVTPFCLNGNGTEPPCQHEIIISPEIDMMKYSTGNDEIQDGTIPQGELPGLAGVILRYEVLRDLPLDNLVFCVWGVRNVVDGCPLSWKDSGYVLYGPNETSYVFAGEDISDLVIHPDSTLQLYFGVRDMCNVWGGIYGSCENHTPCPWFDDIR